MPNYSFVIDSSFRPFSMQEMLVPFSAYKDEFEKEEEAYNDLFNKSDVFKYLADTLPEGSKARQIYEGYANDLKVQAEDFARHGVSMGNRRALLGLKRRYQGEIGRLSRADDALKEERKLRRQMNAKDSSMLYATDSLSIDDFLDEDTPNLYNISGTELYTRGAAAGKSASSRIYSAGDKGSTLGGYYRDYVTRQGFNPDQLNQFQQEMLMRGFTEQVSTLPELQQAAQQILDANGVTQNLTGENLRRAQQQVIRGIVDGSIYDEKHNPTRDLGKMTAAEKDSSDRGWAADRRAKEEWQKRKQAYEDERKLKYTFDKKGNVTGLNPDYVFSSHKTPEQKAMEEIKKKEALERMYNAQKVKNARSVEEADKAGYIPVFVTVHPSHGSGKGLSVEEARRQKRYDNIEGWRSGPQGTDVPDLYIDWTNAPLVEGSQSPVVDFFQWKSGSSASPNNGDFSYKIKGAQSRMLSDEEYAKLPEAVITSITEELRRQGYEEGTPFEVMQVTGRGGKTSYMTLVPKDKQILLGD